MGILKNRAKQNRWGLTRLAALCLCFIFIQLSSHTLAQSEQAEQGFIRFAPGLEPYQGELQTAVVSYRNRQGVVVDLVAAIHIADEDYYRQLNDYFATRDRVLYELVAEANEVPSPGASRGNRSALGLIQQLLANFLQLSFQLNQIDYRASNFLHADLTPTQLQEIMQSKDESFFSMFVSLAMAQTAELQSATPGDSPVPALNMMAIINALNAENQNAAFKSLLAEEMGRTGGVIASPALENQLTILGDRNAVVIDTLKTTLRDPQIRTVSIFYGAAHMPGIERTLLTEMGFERVEQDWLGAWVIP